VVSLSNHVRLKRSLFDKLRANGVALCVLVVYFLRVPKAQTGGICPVLRISMNATTDSKSKLITIENPPVISIEKFLFERICSVS
jgi:hypothetical protein